MRPKARVLPLVFNRNSPELDPVYFDPHLHVHNYYHIIVGGGVNPYIPTVPVFLIRFKGGADLPAPGEYTPWNFNWEEHADSYQYFLVRSPPLPFEFYMSEKADLIVRSGEWCLFQRKSTDIPDAAPTGSPDLPH